jgi:hypothetical protein
MPVRRTLLLAACACTLSATLPFALAAPTRNTEMASEMREWLTYLASDDLEGRNAYSEGYGMAAQYVAERLREFGVKPGGDNGSYFQKVAVRGYKVTDRSTVTIETGGQSRTFAVPADVRWTHTAGGKQTLTLDKVVFAGYGIGATAQTPDDYQGLDVRKALVIWAGNMGPRELPEGARRFMSPSSRNRKATSELGAAAALGVATSFPAAPTPPATATNLPDITDTSRLDLPVPPRATAKDEMSEFLFSAQTVTYPEIKALTAERKPLPHFTLKDVRVTFNVDVEYKPIKTQYTRNVVGIIEGRDAKLRETYLAFGAHLDHVGYAEGEVDPGSGNPRRLEARGRVTAGQVEDRIWNGADDDGSGSVALLSVAKQFAKSKPKRSLLFVWHAGEEKGLLGSKYFVDTPTVPLESIVAQINIDMIGRNRNNSAEEEKTVYLVGADRISTELHNLCVDTNARLSPPLKLNFELNDASDPEQVYYRSDHYSYADKGIPIVFLTTGMHPDYHANTDSPDKIDYDKMAHIVGFTAALAKRVADLDHPPLRDNRGPRSGKTTAGKLP